MKILNNVTIITNAKTKEILGTDKVTGLKYTDMVSNEDKDILISGVFIQIGLLPNTNFIGSLVEKNSFGEIIVDSFGATNISGLFAAGDCTNIPYKQIVIGIGH